MPVSFYLTKRIEFLIDKLLSRRKTIKISKLCSSNSKKGSNDKSAQSLSVDQNKESCTNKMGSQDNQTLPKVTESSKQTFNCQHEASRQILDNGRQDESHDGASSHLHSAGRSVISKRSNEKLLTTNTLAACPSLIYVLLILFISFIVPHQVPAIKADPLSKTATTNPTDQSNPTLRNTNILQDLALNFKVFSDGFLKKYANRERWIRVPDPTNVRLTRRPVSSNNKRRPNPLTRTFERISNRIGSRNTIRVHNAFRDFAWWLMSSLSMPTPVIYELRRQNLYSPEDDLKNDFLHDKNTSKTIRSRSLSSEERQGTSRFINLSSKAQQRSNDDDDGEDDSNLESRLRSRIENLVDLSRRSLFGRVIRLPSLFPFKRQEEENTGKTQNASSSAKGDSSKTSTNRRPSVWRRMRRKRRKDHDRQMISINGKQYYVDDDGELKDWNNQSDS